MEKLTATRTTSYNSAHVDLNLILNPFSSECRAELRSAKADPGWCPGPQSVAEKDVSEATLIKGLCSMIWPRDNHGCAFGFSAAREDIQENEPK
jgi:hypothetical protein